MSGISNRPRPLRAGFAGKVWRTQGKGRRLIGGTNRLGQTPKSRPVTPSNIHATIYQVLGLDPKLHLLDPSGRPVPTLDDAEPIKELF